MEKGHGDSDIDEIKQRALKITEALYRITDIMFDGEPLKWSLRNTAVEILNIVSGLKSGGQMRESERLNGLIQNLFLKLELASSGTFISRINFEVLEREYSILSNHIKRREDEPLLLEYRTEPISDIVLDRSISDEESDNAKEIPEKKEEKAEAKKIEPDPDRKAVIVSALEGNGHSSVSDIAKLFNGTIGEKTVQRELNALVGSGAIKKEGEKRWRRYFL